MAEEEKMIPIGETHETPQAITITIMDPSALGTPNIASSIVTSVEPQKTTGSSTSGNCNLLMVSSSGEQEPKSSILQTVTETHMGTEELPIISSISNPDHDESAELETKISQTLEGMEGEMAQEGPNEPVGQHCLICNIDIEPNEVEEDEEEQQQVPVFKSLTTSTNRRISIFLGGLVGQKLTSRKAHSDIMCRRCFNLLDRVDSLEVEIKETKEEIVNKYQETLTVHGGRARRKKPSTARKSEYVFPKVEPEDEDDQMLGLETDGTFEPRLEDLIEEEHDRREDVNPDDDEWEPEFKRTRIKREIDMDSGVPPKRKRGRPRKDATRPKKWASSNPPDVSRHQTSLARHHVDQLTKGSPQRVTEEAKSEAQKPSASHSTSQQVICLSTDEDCTQNAVSDAHQTCPSCTVMFSSVTDLSKHYNVAHTDVKVISCTKCQIDIKDGFDAYVSHWQTHTKSGTVHRDRKVHTVKNEAHDYPNYNKLPYSKQKMTTCQICKKQVMSRNLNRHINYTHTKKTTYACADCPATYLDSSNLLSHRKRNHMGQEVKRHLCDICGKTFLQPSDLKTHVTGVHQNVRKYICEYCGLNFKISSSLMYHRRSHTGERPHACHVCKTSFSKPSALAKHIRRVHHLEYQGKYRKRLKPSQTQGNPSRVTLSQATSSQEPYKNRVVSMIHMDVSKLHESSPNTHMPEEKESKVPQECINSDVQFLTPVSVPVKIVPQELQASMHEMKDMEPVVSSELLPGSIIKEAASFWHSTFQPSSEEQGNAVTIHNDTVSSQNN